VRADPNSWFCEKLLRLEEIVSVPAIIKEISAYEGSGRSTLLRGNGESLTIETIAEAARAGDELVSKVLERVARTLAWVVCQIDAAFNPEKIILAGPLVTLGNTLLEPLQKAVGGFCRQPHQQPPIVVDSDLGSFNGALGAAALALHEWKPKR
jgi:glucokinase